MGDTIILLRNFKIAFIRSDLLTLTLTIWYIKLLLFTESLKILVHAFVTSRLDYCNSHLALASKTITDELQRVLNAAARLISCTSKYDRGLSAPLHDELHWLDIPQRVQYKLAVTVHWCLRNQAPHRLLRSSVRCCRLPAPAIRQPPSTDCSTCLLQHLRLSLLRFCWSYSLAFTTWQSVQFSCWTRTVSTDSEKWKPTCFACC